MRGQGAGGRAQKVNLKPGDTVLLEESEAGTVCIRRAEPLDIEFLSALEGTLSEGNSDDDERAYRDLYALRGCRCSVSLR